jgi:hypothetical protein
VHFLPILSFLEEDTFRATLWAKFREEKSKVKEAIYKALRPLFSEARPDEFIPIN